VLCGLYFLMSFQSSQPHECSGQLTNTIRWNGSPSIAIGAAQAYPSPPVVPNFGLVNTWYLQTQQHWWKGGSFSWQSAMFLAKLFPGRRMGDSMMTAVTALMRRFDLAAAMPKKGGVSTPFLLDTAIAACCLRHSAHAIIAAKITATMIGIQTQYGNSSRFFMLVLSTSRCLIDVLPVPADSSIPNRSHIHSEPPRPCGVRQGRCANLANERGR
jgi:hypothetical protein